MSEEWNQFILGELKKDYMIKLKDFINEERKTKNVIPTKNNLFRALTLCPYERLKVVILGSEPDSNYSDGLAFSNSIKTKMLDAIFDEIINCEYVKFPTDKRNYDSIFPMTKLDCWAKQGVLLLNTTLTSIKDTPEAHAKIGWQYFIVNLIEYLNTYKYPIVYMLWGKQHVFEQYIDVKKHHVLRADHPLQRKTDNSFKGCAHFSKANMLIKKRNVDEFREQNKLITINWSTR